MGKGYKEKAHHNIITTDVLQTTPQTQTILREDNENDTKIQARRALRIQRIGAFEARGCSLGPSALQEENQSTYPEIQRDTKSSERPAFLCRHQDKWTSLFRQ